ncbi:MAG: glycosyl transferase group 1, partial [bacterium P3]
MRILLINHYVGGGELGMEYRPYYLAKEWVKQGHQVYLLGA